MHFLGGNMEIDIQEVFNKLDNIKEEYSWAKGRLAGLESSKNSVKSIMMKKSSEQSLGGQEREAYASQEYQDHCDLIDEFTAKEALLKLEISIAQMKFEAWRSEQATNRNIERLTR
jgi:hypothetical protein